MINLWSNCYRSNIRKIWLFTWWHYKLNH
jgi:hypothetical protein